MHVGGSQQSGKQALGIPPAPATMPPEMKRLRALQKKVRQAQALIEKQQAGDALTPEEKLKIDNIAEWQKEIAGLEEMLSNK